jgi:hypothetical protein
VGCLVCLLTPVGLGLVTLNAVNAEWGSAAYNISLLVHTSAVAHLAYVVLMTASNALAVYWGILYYNLEKPIGWSIAYTVLFVGLVLMRQGFLMVELVKSCRSQVLSTEEDAPLKKAIDANKRV